MPIKNPKYRKKKKNPFIIQDVEADEEIDRLEEFESDNEEDLDDLVVPDNVVEYLPKPPPVPPKPKKPPISKKEMNKLLADAKDAKRLIEGLNWRRTKGGSKQDKIDKALDKLGEKLSEGKPVKYGKVVKKGLDVVPEHPTPEEFELMTVQQRQVWIKEKRRKDAEKEAREREEFIRLEKEAAAEILRQDEEREQKKRANEPDKELENRTFTNIHYEKLSKVSIDASKKKIIINQIFVNFS